jgi:hypothetical protein
VQLAATNQGDGGSITTTRGIQSCLVSSSTGRNRSNSQADGLALANVRTRREPHAVLADDIGEQSLTTGHGATPLRTIYLRGDDLATCEYTGCARLLKANLPVHQHHMPLQSARAAPW